MSEYIRSRNSGGQGADNWHIDGTCDVEPNGVFNIKGEFQIDGEPIDATAAEINARYLHIHIDDISTLNSNGLVYCPYSGTITEIKSVLGAAISVADATITTKINTTDITDGALTIANGSGKGDIDTAAPTAANVVTAGDYLEAISDGGSTGAATLDVIFKIEL
jgi:hypothetical protein